MRKTLIPSTVKLTLLSAAAIGISLLSSHTLSDGGGFIDYARVTQVSPIYTTVETKVPEQECWVEQVREDSPRQQRGSATSTIVGGIVGGALGNAVGGGSENKKVGTVVGSILGMSIGNDIGRRNGGRYNEVRYRDVERCEVRHRVETHRELVGYNVSYRYQGHDYSTRMNQDPGKKLRVAVNVQPARR